MEHRFTESQLIATLPHNSQVSEVKKLQMINVMHHQILPY